VATPSPTTTVVPSASPSIALASGSPLVPGQPTGLTTPRPSQPSSTGGPTVAPPRTPEPTPRSTHTAPPTPRPTPVPTPQPTPKPTPKPTAQPTQAPTGAPAGAKQRPPCPTKGGTPPGHAKTADPHGSCGDGKGKGKGKGSSGGIILVLPLLASSVAWTVRPERLQRRRRPR
jgi:hypothetical protein